MEHENWYPEDGWISLALIVGVVALVLLVVVSAVGVRDRDAIADAVTSTSIADLDSSAPNPSSAPKALVQAVVPPAGDGYAALASRHEVRVMGYASATTTTVPEAASSMAIERTDTGIVVTNPPEVEVAPGSELERLICSYDWPCARALSVARCESTMNPNAVGRQGEIGLFQIFPRWHRDRLARLGFTEADLFDPAVNVAVAVDLWSEQGWGPWSCR